ncbi:MAG: ABC transporter permease [Oscillospiraceae bacterium]|nr:ABC transporter permease [Oscillospiraceae bacterium]
MKRLKMERNDLALALVLVVLIAVMSMLSDRFLRFGNLMQVLQQMTELGILAIGGTAVIMTAGIDVSVTAVSALTGIMAAFCFRRGLGMAPAIAIALLTALLAGALNGLLVGVCKVNSIVATLGTKSVFSGLALVICSGAPISAFSDRYIFLGQGSVGGVPTQVFILLAVLAAGYILTNRTQLGRCLSVIGNSPEAARYSGIRTKCYTFAAYIFAALCSGIGGIVMSARVATARSDLGGTYQMQVISAILLGGTSFTGGRGKVIGSVVGVLVFAILSNGFNLAGASTFMQQIINGALLIVILVVRAAMDNQKERSMIRQTKQRG